MNFHAFANVEDVDPFKKVNFSIMENDNLNQRKDEKKRDVLLLILLGIIAIFVFPPISFDTSIQSYIK